MNPTKAYNHKEITWKKNSIRKKKAIWSVTMLLVVCIVAEFVRVSFWGQNALNATLTIPSNQLEERGSSMAQGSLVQYPHMNMQREKHTHEK